MKRKKKNYEDYVLDIAIYLTMVVVAVVTFYPMWYVVACSFSTSTEVIKHPGIFLWPENPTIGAYKLVFDDPLIISGFVNILKILIIALPINIVMTVLCGYYMSCSKMMFKKPIVWMMLFTMYFSGGMIPAYLNIRELGMLNTIWSLVIPGCLSIYNAIICKTAIEAIPDSLCESAYIDGANDFQVLFRIVLPLIKATLAVLLLYYGVGHWNSWFNASIYIKENEKLPLQNILRGILLANQGSADKNMMDKYNAYAETIKYAAIVVATVPILCIYPLLQKHFVKGVMIGAVKG